MVKALFDSDALIAQFESAAAQQGERLRQAVGSATLQALQGRELTLKNIRATLKSVTDAANTAVARTGGGVDAAAMVDQAIAGMDDALLQAVDANRRALEQLVAGGADLRDKHLKKALGDLEKFEDTLIAAVRKAAEAAPSALATPWGQALEKMQSGSSGARTSLAAGQLIDDMRDAVRESRAAGMRVAQALVDGYTAMVSGVLIGMSDALQQQQSGRGAARKAAADDDEPAGEGAAAKSSRRRKSS